MSRVFLIGTCTLLIGKTQGQPLRVSIVQRQNLKLSVQWFYVMDCLCAFQFVIFRVKCVTHTRAGVELVVSITLEDLLCYLSRQGRDIP